MFYNYWFNGVLTFNFHSKMTTGRVSYTTKEKVLCSEETANFEFVTPKWTEISNYEQGQNTLSSKKKLEACSLKGKLLTSK